MSPGKMGAAMSATPRATTKPTTRDLAWAAGFLEGEGTFGFYSHSQSIRAPQVQREPLERLQRFFGGTVTARKNPYLNVWTVCGPRARGVMLTLYVMMSPRRREQIKAALGGHRANAA